MMTVRIYAPQGAAVLGEIETLTTHLAVALLIEHGRDALVVAEDDGGAIYRLTAGQWVRDVDWPAIAA